MAQTRTFVATDGVGAVRGYYTLVAGQVEHHEATGAAHKGLSPHFPIPVAILGRLAVDERSQGKGLGARLLDDALERVCRASKSLDFQAFREAADGTRTHDLLHGKQLRGSDSEDKKPAKRKKKRRPGK